MKVIKILISLAAGAIVLAGSFTLGMYITRSRASSAPAQLPGQPTLIPQQQPQTIGVPQQPQATPSPSQRSWRPSLGMMDQNFTLREEWQCEWRYRVPGANPELTPDSAPQGEPGRSTGNCDYYNRYGMHGGMMSGFGWQDNPNWNGVPGPMMNGYGWQANPNWNGMPGGMMNGYGWQAIPNQNFSLNGPDYLRNYPTPSAPVSFKDEVQPIFSKFCVGCHGGLNGLYLDNYENILEGGLNGAVVVPGQVFKSRLAHYVLSGYMPFRNEPLSTTQVQTILDWIAAGALNN